MSDVLVARAVTAVFDNDYIMIQTKTDVLLMTLEQAKEAHEQLSILLAPKIPIELSTANPLRGIS